MWPPVMAVNVVLSILGYSLILNLIPKLKDMFLQAKISGMDVNKRDRPTM